MRSVDLFDDYLNGRLSADEKNNFDIRLETEPVFAQSFEQHKTLVNALAAQTQREALKDKLKRFHKEEFGNDAKIISLGESAIKKFGKTAFIAASTGLIAVFSTMAILSTGGYLLKKQSNEITDLKREVVELKYSQNGIVSAFTNPSAKTPYAPANLEGSGFAINNKGFIITSWHMVNGADSIFLENKTTERTLAKVIISDPKLDIAVLKVEAENVYKNWNVPFGLNAKSIDLGERIYTLGFPRKEIVYGEGALSAVSGLYNDTTLYQISIPINPGNSGGPVMDEQGNLAGVVRGKLATAEGTGYAVKISDILNSIEDSHIEGLEFSTKRSLKSTKRSEQIKRISPYVFNIMVYKSN
jgi:serine protease Do